MVWKCISGVLGLLLLSLFEYRPPQHAGIESYNILPLFGPDEVNVRRRKSLSRSPLVFWYWLGVSWLLMISGVWICGFLSCWNAQWGTSRNKVFGRKLRTNPLPTIIFRINFRIVHTCGWVCSVAPLTLQMYFKQSAMHCSVANTAMTHSTITRWILCWYKKMETS